MSDSIIQNNKYHSHNLFNVYYKLGDYMFRPYFVVIFRPL
jgi:hypothetical protein